MTKTISCPQCGAEIPIVNKIGRKRYDISVENILDAYQACDNNYSKTAGLLSQKFGFPVTRGFVHSRIREAQRNAVI